MIISIWRCRTRLTVIFTSSKPRELRVALAGQAIVRVRNEFQRGHGQVAAIFRSIAVFLPDGRSDTTFGWGFNATAVLETFGKDTFIAEGAYGPGISRYIQDTSGLGIVWKSALRSDSCGS